MGGKTATNITMTTKDKTSIFEMNGMKKSLISFGFAVILLLALLQGAVYALEPVSLNPVSDAAPGDIVVIAGTTTLKEVGIKVILPNTTVFYVDTVKPVGGVFSLSVKLPADSDMGDYTVTAGQGSVVAITTFSVLPTTHTVTVLANPSAGGMVSGGGTYKEGDLVTVTAVANSRYTFTGWTEDGIEISANASYAFTLGTADRTLKANFIADTGYGGGSSGGGGSSSTGPTITTSNDGKTSTTAATVKTDTDSTTGTASAVVGTDVVTALADQAQKSEKSGQKAVVEIKVDTPNNAKTIEVELPRAAFDTAADNTKADLKVSTGLGSITFNAKAVDGISGSAAAGDINIGIARVDTSALSAEMQRRIGDRPVYDFTVKAGNTEISSFGGGSAGISIPYTPKPGENKNAIVVYYIDSQGRLNPVRGRYDEVTGTVNFVTSHFSQYAVGYNAVEFGDVADNAWYRDAVDFIAARGITTGIGRGSYGPEAKLTRGQFLVMLMRAYGMEPDTAVTDNFADAGNTYYTGYLAAAKRLGISGGVGSNMFAPGQEITRQEMCTLLYNALKKIGELPAAGTGGKTLTDFSDTDRVAAWAKDAMTLFVKSGAISGSDGKLNPTDTTNRAQMAQVLHSLLAN